MLPPARPPVCLSVCLHECLPHSVYHALLLEFTKSPHCLNRRSLIHHSTYQSISKSHDLLPPAVTWWTKHKKNHGMDVAGVGNILRNTEN